MASASSTVEVGANRQVSPAKITSHTPGGSAVKPSSIETKTVKRDDFEKPQIIDVELEKGSQGLGFSIVCRHAEVTYHTNSGLADDRPLRVFVKDLIVNGVAYMSGKIQPGDQILEVNGRSLIDVSYAEATDTLRRSTGKVKLRLCRGASMLPSDERPAEVTHAPVSVKEMTSRLNEQNKPKPNPKPFVKTQQFETSQASATVKALASQPNEQTTYKSHDMRAQLTDMNKNDKQQINQHTPSNLREKLLEAQRRRLQLTEQLNQLNSELTLTKRDEHTMETRLVEAECATKKAQRDMIELQRSLSTSQTEYTKLEKELRSKFNELLAKYRETEGIMAQCRNKDEVYNAEREKMRKRQSEIEQKYMLQMNSLNEKIRRLEGNTKCPTGKQSQEPVRLLTHTHIEPVDGPQKTTTSRKSSTSSSSSSSDSEDDDSAKGFGSYNVAAASAGFTGGTDSVTAWSRIEDEPPNYPPPPVPDEVDSDEVNAADKQAKPGLQARFGLEKPKRGHRIDGKRKGDRSSSSSSSESDGGRRTRPSNPIKDVSVQSGGKLENQKQQTSLSSQAVIVKPALSADLTTTKTTTAPGKVLNVNKQKVERKKKTKDDRSSSSDSDEDHRAHSSSKVKELPVISSSRLEGEKKLNLPETKVMDKDKGIVGSLNIGQPKVVVASKPADMKKETGTKMKSKDGDSSRSSSSSDSDKERGRHGDVKKDFSAPNRPKVAMEKKPSADVNTAVKHEGGVDIKLLNKDKDIDKHKESCDKLNADVPKLTAEGKFRAKEKKSDGSSSSSSSDSDDKHRDRSRGAKKEFSVSGGPKLEVEKKQSAELNKSGKHEDGFNTEPWKPVKIKGSGDDIKTDAPKVTTEGKIKRKKKKVPTATLR